MPYLVPDRVPQPLYVIAPIFNPIRYKSRWKLYDRFARHVVDSGAVLITVEAAFGNRTHALESSAPQHEADLRTYAPPGTHHQLVKLRTTHELWLKENMTNLGFAALPADWKYVAWIDADVQFARPNWVGETIQQLQHYDVVQMFSEAIDLGPSAEQTLRHKGFMWCYRHNQPWKTQTNGNYYYGGGSKPITWHPGFAWAARRRAIDYLGGLLDFSILGAGDNHMAHCLIGKAKRSAHAGLHPAYMRLLLEWERRCEVHIRRNVGYVEGLLLHYWHGKKRDRRYKDRWQILVGNQFNPDLDIKRDWQGLYQMQDLGTARSLALRDQVRTYFRMRNEDSIDI